MRLEKAMKDAERYMDAVIKTLPMDYRDYVYYKTLGSDPFREAPASIKHHHVFAGGLLVHTAEVVFAARMIALGLRNQKRTDELTVAAVLHDANKVRDYIKIIQPVSATYVDGKLVTRGATWEKTEHGERIYHVVDGMADFRSWVDSQHSLPSLDNEHIEHIMLAHHGRLEWRSPVEPKTPWALALHHADMMSLSAGYTTLDIEPALSLYS